MAPFPIQAFGTTTRPLFPDGVTILSICVIVAFIRLTMLDEAVGSNCDEVASGEPCWELDD